MRPGWPRYGWPRRLGRLGGSTRGSATLDARGRGALERGERGALERGERGALERGERGALERGERGALERGERGTLAHCWKARGELARVAGRLVEAEIQYRRSLAQARQLSMA